MKPNTILILILSASLLFIAGCGGTAPSSTAPTSSGTAKDSPSGSGSGSNSSSNSGSNPGSDSGAGSGSASSSGTSSGTTAASGTSTTTPSGTGAAPGAGAGSTGSGGNSSVHDAGASGSVGGVITDAAVDVFKEPDLHSERVTQSLYNQSVHILAEKDGWYNVKVVDGYTGWIRSKYISRDSSSVSAGTFKSRVVITSKTKKILSAPSGGVTVKDVMMGTELYCTGRDGQWFEVALPEGKKGFVDINGIMLIDASSPIPKTSASDFVFTAEKLRGSPYLWGGVSALGIDCSGLTYICGRLNGVTLPRDADQQFAALKGEIAPKDVKPGDLLFFSTYENLSDISHVAIYTGDDQFIHASMSSGAVVTGRLSDQYFQKRLAGIRRLF